MWSETLANVNPSVIVNRSHFAPGARTSWHQHPLGQILIIETGLAFIQEKEGPIQTVRAGGTVACTPARLAPGTWHLALARRSAAPTHTMTQFAVTHADALATTPDGETRHRRRIHKRSAQSGQPSAGLIGGLADAVRSVLETSPPCQRKASLV